MPETNKNKSALCDFLNRVSKLELLPILFNNRVSSFYVSSNNFFNFRATVQNQNIITDNSVSKTGTQVSG